MSTVFKVSELRLPKPGECVGNHIWLAADSGMRGTLNALLRLPSLRMSEVNYEHWGTSDSPLLRAIAHGFEDCVRLLLAHPLININFQNYHGVTALRRACSYFNFKTSLVILKLICAHPGVDLNVVDNDNTSPLWNACFRGDLLCVQFLLAHAEFGELRRDVRAKEKRDVFSRLTCNWEGKTALEVSKSPEVREVMASYQSRPRETRRRLRLQLGLLAEDVANLFACAVLVSDGYLQLRRAAQRKRAARFFAIISRLPMELQMMMCHRRYRSAKVFVLSGDTEAALNKIIRCFSSLSPS